MLEIFGNSKKIRSQITSKSLIQAFDYWKKISTENGMPSRSAFDPMEIPRILPITFIVVADDNGEFRYQVAGTMIEEKYQLGMFKDKTPREVMGDRSENVLTTFRHVRDEAVLFYRESYRAWGSYSNKYVNNMVLLMPLSDDGAKVNMILGVQDFLRHPQSECEANSLSR
ncbi:MAG: hypothetical protein ACI9JL_001408 [Paracoccaceae bacterium]|jgi:hypothetical protein